MLEYVEIGSKYTRQRDSLDRERLAARKPKRNHPKRHSVNKEKSLEARRKHREAMRTIATRDEAFREYKALVRAFWKGELACHP